MATAGLEAASGLSCFYAAAVATVWEAAAEAAVEAAVAAVMAAVAESWAVTAVIG